MLLGVVIPVWDYLFVSGRESPTDPVNRTVAVLVQVVVAEVIRPFVPADAIRRFL